MPNTSATRARVERFRPGVVYVRCRRRGPGNPRPCQGYATARPAMVTQGQEAATPTLTNAREESRETQGT